MPRPPQTARSTKLPRFSANLMKPMPIFAAPPTLLDVACSNCMARSRHFLHTCVFVEFMTSRDRPTISSLCIAVAAERNALAALCKQQAACSCLAALHPPEQEVGKHYTRSIHGLPVTRMLLSLRQQHVGTLSRKLLPDLGL